MSRSLLHVFLQALTLTGGLLCLYTSMFLYEDEEGRIQSKLEEWWTKLDDTRNAAVSRNTAFLRTIATLELRILERLFGEKLFSFRAFGVSACLSFSSMGFAILVSCTLLALRGKAPLLSASGMSIVFGFTIVFLLLGLVPAYGARWLLTLWYFLIAVSLLIVTGMFFTATTARMAALLSTGLFISFACDVGFVLLTKWAMRRASNMDTLPRIITVVMTNSVFGIALFVIPAVPVVSRINQNFGVLEYVPFLYLVVAIVAALNEITVVLGLIFAFLVSTMLLHKLCWPIIQRPLYALQLIGIARRRKLFFTIGVALLGVVGINLPGTLKEVLGSLS